jgi:two-component system cell cycle sensor histidine kinase/response regulator CckA
MSGPQVLVAEDEGVLRGHIAEMLTERGLQVMQAADGMEASQILKDNRGISLLLSDVRMPRMDGYALIDEAIARNPVLKVLMMTGNAGGHSPPPVVKAREIATLIKPFDMDRMCDMVVEMLARP